MIGAILILNCTSSMLKMFNFWRGNEFYFGGCISSYEKACIPQNADFLILLFRCWRVESQSVMLDNFLVLGLIYLCTVFF